MTNQQKMAQTYLTFNPDSKWTDTDGSVWWLEDAEPLASDVIKAKKDVKGKKVMRSRHKGQPKPMNHRRVLI